jgi:hypothetical protein
VRPRARARPLHRHPSKTRTTRTGAVVVCVVTFSGTDWRQPPAAARKPAASTARCLLPGWPDVGEHSGCWQPASWVEAERWWLPRGHAIPITACAA